MRRRKGKIKEGPFSALVAVMESAMKIIAVLCAILVLQWQHNVFVQGTAADDDSDVIDWTAMQASDAVDVDENDWNMIQKHLTDEELKQLVHKIDVRHVRRARRDVTGQTRNNKYVNEDLADTGAIPSRSRRAAPFPRLGRASPFPRLGRASPFPRLGRASPFPRLGRASPFPRLGRSEERAAPFPRLGRSEIRAAPFPRLGRAEVRAAPFPRLGRAGDSWPEDEDEGIDYDGQSLDQLAGRIDERASPFPRLG